MKTCLELQMRKNLVLHGHIATYQCSLDSHNVDCKEKEEKREKLVALAAANPSAAWTRKPHGSIHGLEKGLGEALPQRHMVNSMAHVFNNSVYSYPGGLPWPPHKPIQTEIGKIDAMVFSIFPRWQSGWYSTAPE